MSDQGRWVGLYSVYDTVAREYGPVYEAPNDDVAQRSFFNLIRDSPFSSEYKLCFVGRFEKVTGLIDCVELVTICEGMPQRYKEVV